MDSPTNHSHTLWGHISELRRTLIGILLFVALGMGVCLFFYQQIFDLATKPLSSTLQRQEIRRERIVNRGTTVQVYTPLPGETVSSTLIQPGAFIDVERPVGPLVLFSPMEGMLTTFRVCFWLGLLVSSPFWGGILLKFVLPALYPHERNVLLVFLGGSFIALLAGFLFAYFVTIPLANAYLSAFNASLGTNLWSLSHYFDYTLMLMVANGIACEMGLALFVAVHFGLLSRDWMVSKRRHMIVLAFILGALLTPPDVPTQLMVAIPLVVLYELAILYALLRNPNVH